MYERYTVIGVAFALTIIIFDFYLLRKRRIQGKGFVFWFIVGVILGLFSAVPPLYSLLNLLYGTEATISAVMATIFLFMLLILLYMHSRISELQSQLMKLAMEFSLIKHDQDQLSESQQELNPGTLKSKGFHQEMKRKDK